MHCQVFCAWSVVVLAIVAGTDPLVQGASFLRALPKQAGREAAPIKTRATDVSFTYDPRSNVSTQRTVDQVLHDTHASILDFGAVSSLLPTVDYTSAIQAALDSFGDWPGTVFVPNGHYIVQGTLTLTSGKVLAMASGAWFIRQNCSGTSGGVEPPIVRLTSTDATLKGERGSLILSQCDGVPHSTGIVQLGPKVQNPSSGVGINIEWNLIEGITVRGNTYQQVQPDSVGVYCDSTEPFVGGSCYSNTIRNLVVEGVGVGLAAMKYVNANTFTNIQFGGIGQYAILMVNNSENQIHGFFTTGSYNISAVIRGEGSFFNTFTNVQSEPGGGQLLSFDNRSEANTVVGHDNTPHGSQVKDKAFTWVDGGRVNIGDFSDTDPEAGLYGGRQLNVQGKAYIKDLSHGLPRMATSTSKSPTTSVTRTFIREEEPVLLQRQVTLPSVITRDSSSTSTETSMAHLFHLCGFTTLAEHLQMTVGHMMVDFSGAIQFKDGTNNVGEAVAVSYGGKVVIYESGQKDKEARSTTLIHTNVAHVFSAAEPMLLPRLHPHPRSSAEPELGNCLHMNVTIPTAMLRSPASTLKLDGILDIRAVGGSKSKAGVERGQGLYLEDV